MKNVSEPPITCTAFLGSRQVATGSLQAVALAAKALPDAAEPLLVFDDATGQVVDLDLRGSEAAVARRYAPPAPEPEPPRGRGRPKLGVVPREVTLLPRHWAWLAAQPGGASVVLRRLVEAARRGSEAPLRRRRAQEAVHRFLTAMAGDAPGYEDALRALYAGDAAAFRRRLKGWPPDVRAHALALAAPAFPSDRPEPQP